MEKLIDIIGIAGLILIYASVNAVLFRLVDSFWRDRGK